MNFQPFAGTCYYLLQREKQGFSLGWTKQWSWRQIYHVEYNGQLNNIFIMWDVCYGTFLKFKAYMETTGNKTVYAFKTRNPRPTRRIYKSIILQIKQKGNCDALLDLCNSNNATFLYLLKMSENQSFPDVFKGYRFWTLALNGLNI